MSPLTLHIDVPKFSAQIGRTPRVEWDRDKIMNALRGEGDDKRDFLMAVESRLQQEDPQWTDMLRQGDTDAFFDYMNRVLVEAGQELFRPGQKEEYKLDADHRRELLRQPAGNRLAFWGFDGRRERRLPRPPPPRRQDLVRLGV